MRILLFFIFISTPAIAQGIFVAGPTMNYARTSHTATLLADGTVLIAGGYDRGAVNSTEIYDPVAATFTSIGGMVNDSPATATLLVDGKVLLVGAIAQLYDPLTQTFTVTGNGAGQHGCAATLLGNGKILFTDDPSPYGFSNAAEIYDPDSGSFSPTGPYASLDLARADRALAPNWGGWDCRRSTLLADGRVLVAGGVAAEIYDPRTNTFALTGVLSTFSDGAMSTLPVWSDSSRANLLLNGMVLFSGGDGDLGPSIEAWLYNPSSGTFQHTAYMSTPRAENSATLLPDGTVLEAGSFGFGAFGSTAPGAINSADLYDPVIAMFSATGPMATTRFDHTATLLNDGRVLIAGGSTHDNSSLATTELYMPLQRVQAPSLFLVPGMMSSQGAIWHGDTGTIASSVNPAKAAELLSMYTSNLGETGVIPPRVVVGGRLAYVEYFGPAPGYPSYYQVNFRIPDQVAAGPSVPVRLMYLGRSSNSVTIGVQ